MSATDHLKHSLFYASMSAYAVCHAVGLCQIANYAEYRGKGTRNNGTSTPEIEER